VRLFSSAMTLIRWQPASHYCCKFLQDHVTLRGRCGSCGKAISRLRSSWQRGAGARKEGFTTFNLAASHPQKFVPRPRPIRNTMHKRFCTSSPDGHTFRITLRIHQAAASASAATASQAQVNDPTKGFFFLSFPRSISSGLQSKQRFLPSEIIPGPGHMAVSKNVTQI
jgi:hypothetical protein